MKTVFYIDGGAGRAIAAIPAFLKYHRLNPGTNWYIIVSTWENLYWGIPELQDRTFGIDTKGIFDNVIRTADRFIAPEPYQIPEYYRQELSMSAAFDREINGTLDHTDLGAPVMNFSRSEIAVAKNTIADLKEIQKKQKTIVIQPFGRGAKIDRDTITDDDSRSLDITTYLSLVSRLSTDYNLIFFGEPQFLIKSDVFTANYTCELRQWGALIQQSDYFIGIDSVGQHMARATNTPGTVIFGSTFPINTSYPDYFNIFEKSVNKKYCAIRITGLDNMLASRLNEHSMQFSQQELDVMYRSIISDITNSPNVH